ncbi:hypothetical protein [Bacillus weihaiensis]|uniref:Uncharacterized protein n=1 Tax=Bacillus weihaiensis TaxID=1547283 RepID=A0A1L3MTD5_9BACI|nr:hypothetical protein [Bacillus weihaiensis]APH05596.1 hypothetical protein A9C19_13010 [Bacillus weihaiensis]
MIVKSLIYLFFISIMGLIDGRKLVKEKKKKDLFIHVSIIGVSSILYILYVLEIRIPNPLEAIQVIFEPVGLFIDRILGGETS